MTCHGVVKNGIVVLDEPAALPEGSRVCIVLESESQAGESPADSGSLYDDLMEFAGKANALPEDASDNVDHYLYGHPKV